jgi:autotransporter-associated beta strand protein
VAQITPYGSSCPGIVKYNTYIRDVLVPYFAGKGKHVTTVNQYTNMCFPGTTNIDGSLFANGINHPMPAVYDKMAQTWFEGIQALMPLPPPGVPPASTAVKWSGAGSGDWDMATTNWAQVSGGMPTIYTDGTPGNSVQFDDTLAGNPALTLNTTVTPGALVFTNQSTAYSISGAGGLAGYTGLIKAGAGTVTLNTSNTFTGDLTVNLGTLVLNGANACGNTVLISNAVVRAGNSRALGAGTVSISGAQMDSCRVELTGGITITNTLSLRSRNYPLGYPAHVLNVSGTNTLDPAGDLVLSTGGNVLALQSDSGLLVLTKGMTNTASAPRYLALLGAGNGEVRGSISVNGGVAKLGSGTWTLTGSSPMGGPTVISNGTLVVNGSLTSSANNVTNAGGTLAGYGTIAGPVTVQAAGTLAPGNSVGKLTINNTLTLQGTAVMEIARNGTVLTNDLVTGVKTNTYGGTLIVTNVGSSPLQVGDAFKLFAATNYAGTFASIVYPVGYTFSNSLAVDGTIKVLTVPVSTPPNFPAGSVVKLPDGNFSLMATGAVGAPYRLWASTNVTLTPITNLWTLLTNGTISTSPFTIIDAAATNYPQRFYRFSTP